MLHLVLEFLLHKAVPRERPIRIRNIELREAVCEHCGADVKLLSYDATVLHLFSGMPVWVGRRYHFTDVCPSCEHSQLTPIKMWESIKARILKGALEACQADPGNARLARKALETVRLYPDRESFLPLGEFLQRAFLNDSDIQLELGRLYIHYKDWGAAERAARAGLTKEDKWELHEVLTTALIRLSRPAEAWPFLQRLLDEEAFDKKELLFLAVECYQAWGMHDQALTILDAFAQSFPYLSHKEDYQRLRAISEHHVQTGRKVSSADFPEAR